MIKESNPNKLEDAQFIHVETGDWNKNLTNMSFYKIANDGFLNWNKNDNNEVYCVLLEIIKGVDISSHEIAVTFDEISKGYFYYRDNTSDTLPFVNDGDTYWSSFCFQYKEDAENFAKISKGKGSWMIDFNSFRQACNDRKDRKSINEK